LPVLIQESLSVAHNTGALASRDLERAVVDTTVQPKATAHPSDARLCHAAKCSNMFARPQARSNSSLFQQIRKNPGSPLTDATAPAAPHWVSSRR